MNKLTREEALRRWKSAKATKKAMVDKMQKMLYEDYKLRTGEEPVRFKVLLQLLLVFIKIGNVIYSLEQRNKVTNDGGLSAAFTVSSNLCLMKSKSWWGSSDEGHQTKMS